MSDPSPVPAPSKLAFSYIGFRFYWLTTLSVSFAVQIMSVSIAWQIYDVTGEAFLLVLVGLPLFLPSLVLILLMGRGAPLGPVAETPASTTTARKTAAAAAIAAAVFTGEEPRRTAAGSTSVGPVSGGRMGGMEVIVSRAREKEARARTHRRPA